MEGSGELVHLPCSQGDTSSLIAHGTKGMGIKYIFDWRLSSCDQSHFHVAPTAGCCLYFKVSENTGYKFLVLDGVGKSFDVFEVKTSKKWSSACVPEKNYILVPYLEKRMKNKTKDPVIP